MSNNMNNNNGGVNRRTDSSQSLHSVSLREVETNYGADSWQSKAWRFLHRHDVEQTLTLLLILDLIVVMVELFLEAENPACHVIERNSASCCIVDGGEKEHLLRFLEATGDHYSQICPSDYSHIGDGFCLHHDDWVHHAHNALFGITIIVLSIFQIEILVKAVILKKNFFREWLYIFDLLVITVSLVFALIFRLAQNRIGGDIASMIVVLRFWRYVRVWHGLFENTYKYAEHEMQEMQNQYEDKVKRLESEIVALKKELLKN